MEFTNEELIVKVHEGSREAMDLLVEKNSGLVWSIVKRFLNRGYDKEDLYQIGSIGLIKAIRKFDTSFNTQFLYVQFLQLVFQAFLLLDFEFFLKLFLLLQFFKTH